MEKLNTFAKKSYDTVPMYIRKRCVRDDMKWEDYPTIEKNEVIEQEAGAIAAYAIPLYYGNKLIRTRTSGSTGKYMEIYWKKSDYAKSMMPLWILRKKYYDINPEDKMCFFFTIMEIGNNDKDRIIQGNQIGYSKSNLSMERLKTIYLEMLEYKPLWMLLQPSMAILLCRCVKRYNLPKLDSIKYIELTGEILRDEVRKLIIETFDCKIANQYGANEFNSIAYECPYGNMHIMTSNVYVEVLDKAGNILTDDREGKLYITTKTNTAMPLIRYGIGDTGKIEQCECGCESKRPILRLTSGRTNELIQTESGEEKTVYTLIRAIDNINYEMDGLIKQFQIEQNSYTDFIIKLVIDEDEQDYIPVEELKKLFVNGIYDEELKKCNYSIWIEDEMFPEEVMYDENGNVAGGKFKYFKRKIKEI